MNSEQIRAAVSNHFQHLYDQGVKSMTAAGKPLAPRPLLSLAQRVAKAVNYEYFNTFQDEWVPSVQIHANKNAMIGMGEVTIHICFVMRNGMSMN